MIKDPPPPGFFSRIFTKSMLPLKMTISTAFGNINKRRCTKRGFLKPFYEKIYLSLSHNLNSTTPQILYNI